MAGAKKNFKATKKFESKHLKGVLDQRKASAKVKQRHLLKTKKQAKRSKDAEFYKGPEGEDAPAKPNGNKRTANVGEMSVDDFFGGGFEIIDKAQQADKKTTKKLGKRKRADPEDGDEMDDVDMDSSDADEQAFGDEDEDAEDDDAGVGMSKGAMDALAKDDPEFYKYLKENDPEALEFDDADLAEVDELSAGDEEDEDEEEQQPMKKRKNDQKSSKKIRDKTEEESEDEEDGLTQATVARWKASMVERHSLRAARQVVLAFRSAAHLNEDDGEELKKERYTITSPEVFHDVLIVALTQIPDVLRHHVPLKEVKGKDGVSAKVQVPTESRKFKVLGMLLKTYVTSILHILGTLSDDATLKLTLSALEPLVPYLMSFRKLLKSLIKTVVSFWSTSTHSEVTRITAFSVMLRLVVAGDKGIRETVLKAAYQGLVAGSRVTNINTVQAINLMKNSAATLWGVDQSIGYTTAFNSIRQLAIHLRNSIVHNQNDSFKKVYNWQYIHSLDFWSRVLSEHCNTLKEAEAGKESQLRLLIYPLVQVTLGAMRLIPTATYFPLRFHLIRSLLRVSTSTGTYIPLASALLEVLNSAEMRKTPKQSTVKALDFSVAYRAPKSYLRTRVYQDGVGDQVVELFAEFFALWSKNIAFPEFALPVVIMLKRWLKQSRKAVGGNINNKLRSSLVLLVQKLETNAKFIEGKRAKVDFAPRDRSQVDAFLADLDWEKTPVGAYVIGQRKAAAEKSKLLEQARKEDERKRKEDELEARELDGDEDGFVDVDDDEDDGDELDEMGEDEEEEDEVMEDEVEDEED